ncbi:acyl-ACP--UDP-N-acetylglucosamine O-acyltransferase [Cyanobium sp. NIES-981]|uniref:acyl-ACP--UDP-N-acetylglucosamine O-acyltransferase n=1 Tax=Cyanobium sp. NIES-981 TaxID=1851505 RepID=UPI0007DDCD00|nr:acyl-ACP--UDP-N-acetylglucosamine O-acyltransferase [Cyanobium sp. NIES-981]SBO44476.1 Acyl-[acyl-carrier-protein]--UDP-N-acetylglucosamine O-acyltransferase [Cyanobium sp. NIES-981]
MATTVHATAVVDPRAELAAGVQVGPYAVVGPEVTLGEGCRIGPHVVLDGRVRMGRGNRIFPGACIGLEPQDLKYTGDPTEVVIGNDNTIRECVTINRATTGRQQTRIGDGNLLMAYSHLGHNCHLGDRIVIANGVAVAGHVVIGDRAVIGGVLGIHQFVQIGTLAMVGGMSRIERDVPPFTLVEGHPSRVRALNTIGLRRSGLTERDGGRQYADLKQAWTVLYRQRRTLAQALAQLRSAPLTEAAETLVAFLEASLEPSRRGPIPGAR